MQLGDLDWTAFGAGAAQAYAIIPVGALEPHGPHLPLATDTIISEFLARHLAEAIDGWVLPCLGYGVATPSYRLGGDFPGVVNISGATFTALVTDILASLARAGVRRFVVVNSAIDNQAFLCGVVYRADQASGEIGHRVAERVLDNLAAAVRAEFA